MNLGDMIYAQLAHTKSNIDFLPLTLTIQIPLYFQRVFMQYSPLAVEGLEPNVKPGGFMYEGEVEGPTYTYPMAGNDYGIAAAVTPPLNIIDAEKACRQPGPFWAPIFQMIGKYITTCKISFCNVVAGLSVPFIIGWDEGTKKAQPNLKAFLDSTEKSIPETFLAYGETFEAVIHESMLSSAKDVWSLFGDYVDMAIISTMAWTFQLTTLKNPSIKNPGLPGTFTGSLQAFFTKLP